MVPQEGQVINIKTLSRRRLHHQLKLIKEEKNEEKPCKKVD
jgi:hypothetical protein